MVRVPLFARGRPEFLMSLREKRLACEMIRQMFRLSTNGRHPSNALVFAARSQAFRAGVAHLLPYVEPLVKRWGAVANISASGEKVSLLLDLKGEKVTAVASVHQRGRWLCLGNLMGKGVSVLKLGEGE